MPSGGCDVTPGYHLEPGEKVNNAKLNQGFEPVVRVGENAITSREVNEDELRGAFNLTGRNLFCNPGFQIWDHPTKPLTGVITPGSPQDFGIANRWTIANDANRVADQGIFDAGQTDVPGSPTYYLHWTQSAALAVNPAYLGQRLEDVRRFDGATLTFSIWIKATTPLQVTPQARQFFGKSGGDSPAVVYTGAAVNLAANTWTFIKQTFALGNLVGKTISNAVNSFTEFRILMPQGTPFDVGFANPQVEIGSAATTFEPKAPHDDVIFAKRYYQVLGILLSSNLTQKKPFLNLAIPMRGPFVLPGSPNNNINLFPFAGTGAALGFYNTLFPPTGGLSGMFTQEVAHSVESTATIFINCEMFD